MYKIVNSGMILFSASKATNFIFRITGLNNNHLESVEVIKNIKEKVKAIKKLGGDLEFVQVENCTFSNNLTLIDSKLPDIFSNMILTYYSEDFSRVDQVTHEIATANPLGYNLACNHNFYEYKIKHLLNDIALGMRPTDVWLGKYDATGGFLVVKEDGELVCYHIYSKNSFEDYLYHNTKFDTPSSSRHGFGHIYDLNEEFFIKLNVQIRFL